MRPEEEKLQAQFFESSVAASSLMGKRSVGAKTKSLQGPNVKIRFEDDVEEILQEESSKSGGSDWDDDKEEKKDMDKDDNESNEASADSDDQAPFTPSSKGATARLF